MRLERGRRKKGKSLFLPCCCASFSRCVSRRTTNVRPPSHTYRIGRTRPHHRVASGGGGGRASGADARRKIDRASQNFLQRRVTDISFGREDDELRATLPVVAFLFAPSVTTAGRSACSIASRHSFPAVESFGGSSRTEGFPIRAFPRGHGTKDHVRRRRA